MGYQHLPATVVLILGALTIHELISPFMHTRTSTGLPVSALSQEQQHQLPSLSSSGHRGSGRRKRAEAAPLTPWRDVAAWLAGHGASHQAWDQIQEGHQASLNEIRKYQELFEATFLPGAQAMSATLPDSIASVFYPFGGPDIASARALFPKARRFLLAGLNPAAGPNLTSLADKQATELLGQTLDAMGTLFRRSLGGQFMFQESMRALGTTVGVGMAAPLLSALGRSQLDCHVDKVRVLSHGDSSPASGQGIGPGVQLQLASRRRPHHVTVEYWEANLYSELACHQLQDRVQGLPKPVALMLKSASYALFDAPETLKSCLKALTAGSGAIVVIQDDAGMPMAWVDEMMSRREDSGLEAISSWEVTPYGGYSAGATNSPYSQKGLQLRFDNHPGGPRPLGRMRYGYCPSYTPQERQTLEAQGAQQDADARQEAERAAGMLGDDCDGGGRGLGQSPGVCNVIVAVDWQSTRREPVS